VSGSHLSVGSVRAMNAPCLLKEPRTRTCRAFQLHCAQAPPWPTVPPVCVCVCLCVVVAAGPALKLNIIWTVKKYGPTLVKILKTMFYIIY